MCHQGGKKTGQQGGGVKEKTEGRRAWRVIKKRLRRPRRKTKKCKRDGFAENGQKKTRQGMCRTYSGFGGAGRKIEVREFGAQCKRTKANSV